MLFFIATFYSEKSNVLFDRTSFVAHKSMAKLIIIIIFY